MEGAAQTILSNAGQLLSEEYRLLRGVSSEVIELRDDLDTMNSLLRMQSEAEDGAVDHFVRGWMKQLRELAYDSEDSIDLYKLRVKSRANEGVRAWLERLVGTIFLRRRLACEIGALRARAVAISERHARYAVVNRDALRRSSIFAPPVPASSSVHGLRLDNDREHHNQQAVAIEDQADVLAARVKASVEEESHLKVFPIVGTKDIDRSTLAMEVCRRLEAEFPFQATVKVSQALEHSEDPKPLLKQVLEQVAKPKVENVDIQAPLSDMESLDVDQLAKILEERLVDKRYLIVLDDVPDATSYNAIQSKLPENNCGCRIIITTTLVVAETVAGADSNIHDLDAPKSGHRSHQFIGIGSQVKSLVDRLKKDPEEGGLTVLSIVGFGGLGKTTLAIQVCRQLEEAFPLQAMVSVSQAFEPSRDLKPLLKRMLEQVAKPKTANATGVKEGGSVSDIDTLQEEQLTEKLKERLQDNRYLIVIDDVWTFRAWNAIQFVLPKNNKGSRIIVTTRIKTVAQSCSPGSDSGNYIHQMEPLNPSDSKKLFLSRVFGSQQASYPKELEDVMVKILDKCGNLPLAIVSIASILVGSRRKDKWETVCNSIGSEMMEGNHNLEGLKHMVTLSYNHLPHELKACMMYLSIFPEDYEIKADRVLSRWIAEGLVLEKRGWTQMEVAESYMEALLSRNMIQPVRFGYDGKVKCFRVHDMLLEVMVSMSLECNFVSLLGGQYATMSYGRIRRLSIHGDDNDRRPKGTKQHSRKSAGGGIQGMDVEHVRSLSMFQHKGQKLLDDLVKFTLLRVLDLQDCEGLTNNHMGNVCKLYLLRFLNLKGTNITKVPRQVGKLEHLQAFNVSDTGVNYLPKTVTKLDKLERLDLFNKNRWDDMWNLPRGLKKMKALRKLTWVILGDDVQVAKEMGELEQLEELKFHIDSEKIKEKGNEEEITTELARSLSRLYSLRRLNIGDLHWNYIMDFLHHLESPPLLLRHLRIAGYIHNGIPSWVQLLTNLDSFQISCAGLVGDQLYDALCKLPNLKSIEIEYECYFDERLVARKNHNFPSLVDLKVIYNSGTPKVIEFEQGSMPKLDKLTIDFENKKEIVGIKNLPNLKEVELTGSRNNTALRDALDQLKAENGERSNQFQVAVKYW